MDLAQRLSAGDAEATASFLREWIGAVHRYCVTVCEPHRVQDAIESVFVDFFEKAASHPIDDAHLAAALMRSTRLAAAESARVDQHVAAAESDGDAAFECEMTPPFLAGSPSVPAGVEALRRMRDHVGACPRCQATESRFVRAEEGFLASEGADVAPEVLEGVLDRFSIPYDNADPVPGFRIVSVWERDVQGIAVCTVADRQAKDDATLWMASGEGVPDLPARFLHDARLLAGLEHPSLPRVRAVGETPEGAYLVTDRLQGRTLMSVAGSGPPSEQALRMLGEVAEALDTAHAAGLVHGELRPANVVVGEWLVVRAVLVGFALGRDVAGDGEQAPYMSPEQLRGEAAGPAADRYALACTLFELLTGDPPFASSNGAARRRSPEPPSRVNAGLPGAVDPVFQRALASSPDQRPSSAAELVADVARALSAAPADAPEDVAPVPAPTGEPVEAAIEQVEPKTEPVATPPDAEPDAPTEAPWAAAESEAGPAPQAEHSGAAATGPVVQPDTAEPDHDQVPDASPGRDRTRRSRKLAVVAAGLVAAVVTVLVVVLVGGSGGTDRSGSQKPSPSPSASEGVGQPRRSRPRPERLRTVPVALAGAKATDFDPNGGNGERPDEVANVIDGNPMTLWQTESYRAGTFGRGVGVYIALPRPQVVREVTVRTSTPGWDAEVYGASNGPPAQLTMPGWTKLGSQTKMRAEERIRLVGDATPISFCLIWVTKLPPNGLVSIGEISLLGER